MRLPCIRIGWAMTLIAVAALDLAACRAVLASFGPEGEPRPIPIGTLLVGGMPMAHVLVGGLLLALRRPGSRFLLGFEAAGLAALATFLALALGHHRDLVVPYEVRLLLPVSHAVAPYFPEPSRWEDAIIAVATAAILGWWQLALAIIGGLVSKAVYLGTSLVSTRCYRSSQ
jgi:hypothetical protein